MKDKYLIAGTGNAKKNVIEDGLADVISSRDVTFLLSARRGASEGERRVYDYLLDHGAKFYLIGNAEVPTVLEKAALGKIDVISESPESIEVLYLWDETDEETSEEDVARWCEGGYVVKDLTQGLTPLRLADVIESVDVATKTDEELQPFTKAELSGMAIGVLRKQAEAQGIQHKALTKEELVEKLLGEEPVVKSSTRPTQEIEEGVMIVVVFPNGTVVSTPGTMAEARTLLGMSN
jgi:hypothetical protein